MCKEGKAKRLWDKSQRVSVRCKVQSGESFRSSLYACADYSEWPERKPLNLTMVDPDKYILLGN